MEDRCASATPCRVTIASLDELTALWRDHGAALQWTCPFVLPPWLRAWWTVLGADARPWVAVVLQGEAIIGVAPLMIQDKTIRFLGGSDVCDYFDCVVRQDQERLFFTTLLAHLAALGCHELDLGPVRSDAAVYKFFSEGEPSAGVTWRIGQEDVLAQLDLPETWEEFLGSLDGKQRHELRRKLRRLHEAGRVRFRSVDDGAHLREAVEIFLRLFILNRQDKAAFMTPPMVSFFRTLAFALAEEGMLRLFFLEVADLPVASVFCFDYLGIRYLYNNGYDDAYQGLSVGLLSKVLSLQAAIAEGLRTFSLLKGGETYKYRLGGKLLPLVRCRVTWG
jgi:CelD/BcsL family acetyltransferase involved in cellulose biosynthesis